MTDTGTNPGLGAELADLRARLAEAEETLRAIRGGEADALVIAGSAGDEVHLLGKVDRIYRQFIETIREGTATVSASGIILSCSSNFAQILRRPLDQLLGTAMRDHLPPDDHEVFAAILAQACPVSHRRRVHLKTSEGDLVPVYLSAAWLRSSGAEPVCCLIFTDLEEAISAEQALRESEARYRRLFTSMIDCFVQTRMSGEILMVNPAFVAMLGYTEAELRQRRYQDLTPERWQAFEQKIVQTQILPRGYSDVYEKEYVRKDGTVFPVELRTFLLRDDEGRPAGMWAIVRDITERKAAEARILRLTQLYAALSKGNEASIRSASEEELFTTVCRAAVEVGGMKMAWVGLVDGPNQRVQPVASCGEGVEYLQDIRISVDAGDPFGRGPIGTAIRENRAFWCQDFRHDPVTAPWHERGERFGWAAAAALPLTRNGNPVGVLTLYAGKVEAFDQETRKLLTEMANNISFAMDKFAAETERRQVVEELRVSRLLYQKTLSSLNEAVFVVDVKTRLVLDCNETTETIFGWSPEELIGRDTRPLHVDDETFAAFTREMLAQIERTGFAAFESRMRRRNGDVFPTEHFMRLLQSGNDGSSSVVSVVRDITERKRAEDALRASRQLLEGIINAIPVRVFWKDRGLAFLGCNAAFAHDAGLADPQQVIGKNDFQMVWGEQADRYRDDDRRVIESGEQRLLIEEPQTTPDGRTITLLMSKLPLRDAAGEIIGVLGTYIDITERKRLETERVQLSVAIEQAAETVMITDARGRIRYVNPVFETLTGYSCEEVLGKRARLLKSGEHDAALYRKVLRDLRSGLVWRGRLVNSKKDGTLFTVETTISPVRDETGRIVSYVGVERDVTEELRLVEEKSGLEDQLRQAQKIEAIGRLAGGVAHDFNNLTAIILGYGEMLLGQLHPDLPARKWAEQIVAAGKRSAALTRQLLAFSRKQLLLPVVLDLNGLLRNLEKMLGRIIGEDIDLTLDLAEGLGRVTVDPGQIEQVVTNLVINARDAMPHGGKLTVETANVELDETFAAEHRGVVPGEYVRLTLTDTGCGMDKATLARLFEPFFTTKPQGKGTGLGLATSFGIVKQSGGYMYVASAPDQGTTFTIYLPLTRAEPKAEESDARGAAPRGAGERILLVEDEASLLELCAITLARIGYSVCTAGSGPEALALVEKRACDPDLVVTDVIMPGMSGTELVKRLRGGRPGLKVLFMSGYPDETIAPHGVLSPGVSFLAKPFSESGLAAKVSVALGSRTPAPAPGRRGVRVLMIDDDTQYQELVRHFCAKHGHTCAGADTAAAALTALAGQTFDVLLVDLNIPGTSGEDILRKIRAAGHAAPAIVLTGDVASADMDALRPLGAVQALEKSSDGEPLLQAIEKAAALDGPPRDTGAR